jgi:hypothetical protein
LATEVTRAEEAPPPMPSAARGDSPPPPEGMETTSRANSVSPEPVQAQQLYEEGVLGDGRVSPEAIVRDTVGAEKPQRSELLPEIEAENALDASTRHSGPEAVPTEEDISNTEGPSTSRPRSPFEILRLGLRGCPMEAMKI